MSIIVIVIDAAVMLPASKVPNIQAVSSCSFIFTACPPQYTPARTQSGPSECVLSVTYTPAHTEVGLSECVLSIAKDNLKRWLVWPVKREMDCFLFYLYCFVGEGSITSNQAYKLLNRQSSTGPLETSAVLIIIVLRVNRDLVQIIYFWASVLLKHLSVN